MDFCAVNLIKTFASRFREPKKLSYAQCGEDLIVQFILDALSISKPSYLDIGAHHPVKFSNTFLFYKNGSQGVCVEPNPVLYARFKLKRPRDICLNVGIGISNIDYADFHILTTDTLSSFSKDTVEQYLSFRNQKVEKIVRVPLLPINDILRTYFERCPDFVSLDTEGLDFDILKNTDFGTFRPKVFCVETINYTEDKSEKKSTDIIEWMNRQGFKLFADTYINTIFVDQTAWSQRL